MHQALFGVYLGMTFAPNHKGMPHPTGDEDYLRKQVLTSRNVRGGWLDRRGAGRPELPDRAPPVPGHADARTCARRSRSSQAYCAEIGVAYELTGLIDSYRQALRHLHEVGAPLREAAKVK